MITEALDQWIERQPGLRRVRMLPKAYAQLVRELGPEFPVYWWGTVYKGVEIVPV